MSKNMEKAGAFEAPDERRRDAAIAPAAHGKKAAREAREERLSEALRANLKRRKAARKEQE
jgi:hypothetical protein